jgi:hypothetical protein
MRRIKITQFLSLFTLLMLSCSLSAASSESVASQMAEINEQYRQLLQKMQDVEKERRQLELQVHQVAELSEQRGGQNTATATVGDEQRKKLEAQQEELPDLPRVSEAVGGVLTPKGRLVLETAVQYTNTAVTRVALQGLGIFDAAFFGDIDVRSVERETATAALTARYGITSRLEAELKASYVKRSDNTITRPVVNQNTSDRVFNATGDGLGDIEFGLRYQFDKQPNWPYLVGNLRIKSDTGKDPFEIQTRELMATGSSNFAGKLGTGSGFWSVNPSLTFIYPSDPVAIFGNIGYLWTLPDDKGTFLDQNDVVRGFGKVDPGDAIRLNFGMGIGLNEMSSISFSYALDRFSHTRIANATREKINGSDVTVGKFLIGYSLKLGEKGLPLNIAIGIGTTDAAPDTDITLRIPFTVKD